MPPLSPLTAFFFSQWSLSEVPADQIATALEVSRRAIAQMLSTARKLGFGDDSATIDDVEGRCRKHSVNFLDPDFPPTASALCVRAPRRHATPRHAMPLRSPAPLSYVTDPVDGAVIADGMPICFRRPADFMT